MSLKFYRRVERGCGTRNDKGFYLMSTGIAVGCHRLPLDVPVCKCCGAHMIPYKIRGIAQFNPHRVFGECQNRERQPCHFFKIHHPASGDLTLEGRGCPVCFPPKKGWYMSVGEENYSTKSFSAEAALYGVSKKVRAIPKDLQKGEYLYLGFRKAVFDSSIGEEGEWVPQIFMAVPITGLEKLVNPEIIRRAKANDKQAQAYLKDLEDRGIDAVVEYDDPAEIADLTEMGKDMGEPGPMGGPEVAEG